MSRESTRKYMHGVLSDDDAQAAREAFCRTSTRELERAGRRMQMLAFIGGGETERGLSLVTRMGAELAQGTCTLLDAGNAYAAGALVRQVVEVEYLLWTFADDIEDAARWLKATPDERYQRFRPAAMRKRSDGRFRAEEYKSHCDLGGHPNPLGWALLAAADPPLDPVRASWVDLGQHLERAWGLLVTACETTDNAPATADGAEAMEVARTDWHERDPLAPREPLSWITCSRPATATSS